MFQAWNTCDAMSSRW